MNTIRSSPNTASNNIRSFTNLQKVLSQTDQTGFLTYEQIMQHMFAEVLIEMLEEEKIDRSMWRKKKYLTVTDLTVKMYVRGDTDDQGWVNIAQRELLLGWFAESCSTSETEGAPWYSPSSQSYSLWLLWWCSMCYKRWVCLPGRGRQENAK